MSIKAIEYIKNIDRRKCVKALVFSILMLYPLLIFVLGLRLVYIVPGLAIWMFIWSSFAVWTFWTIVYKEDLRGYLISKKKNELNTVVSSIMKRIHEDFHSISN